MSKAKANSVHLLAAKVIEVEVVVVMISVGLLSNKPFTSMVLPFDLTRLKLREVTQY